MKTYKMCSWCGKNLEYDTNYGFCSNSPCKDNWYSQRDFLYKGIIRVAGYGPGKFDGIDPDTGHAIVYLDDGKSTPHLIPPANLSEYVLPIKPQRQRRKAGAK